MLLFNLVMLNEINQTNNETINKFEVGDGCDNETFFEEGFICCNFSVCDQYCYKNECIPPNKVWFCFEIGIFYCFAIKHFASFISLIFSVIARFCYNTRNEIRHLIPTYIGVFLIDLSFWFTLNGWFCSSFEVWSKIFENGLFLYILCWWFTKFILAYLECEFECWEQKMDEMRGRYSSISFKYWENFMDIRYIYNVFFNLYFVIDFFLYISSNNYRKMWKKYMKTKEKERINKGYVIL